jgi:hypothetical protein
MQYDAPKQSLGSIIKEGVGFGAGAEIGRTAVRSVFGLFSGPAPVASVVASPDINATSEGYKQCLQYTKNDTETCKPFLSKDKSPWTQCMEANLYQKDYC